MSNMLKDPLWKRWQPPYFSVGESVEDDYDSHIIDECFQPDETNDPDASNEYLVLTQQDHAYEEGKRLGFEAGQTQGYEAGKALGLQEMHQQQVDEQAALLAHQSARFEKLFSALQESFEQLEQIIPQRLTQFALEAVKALIGETILQKSLDERLRLQIASRMNDTQWIKQDVQLWISAEDHGTIEALFNTTLGQKGWVLKVDNSMLPGGCRLSYDNGELDERIESRWKMLCQLARAETTV